MARNTRPAPSARHRVEHMSQPIVFDLFGVILRTQAAEVFASPEQVRAQVARS
jgi:hypothetical protein